VPDKKGMENFGQDVDFWTNQWANTGIESEIRMWDFFGGRPWILKFTPRFGKVLEAGCGLGRYNFYLSTLGIEIIGLDFSEKTIDLLNKWKIRKNFKEVCFINGDILKLPFGNESLSGYLSFGVVEHFQEGPSKPLAEAFRVLRPGGIAIITTPNRSWNIIRIKYYDLLKSHIKKIIGKKINNNFYQYEYTPKQLKKHLENTGLVVTEYTGTDFLYTFNEYYKFKAKHVKIRSAIFNLSHLLDRSVLRRYGAQSITVSVKTAERMHCFFCNELSATPKSLNAFAVPVCTACSQISIAKHYLKKSETMFHNKYIIDPEVLPVEKRECEFCGMKYQTDILFEDFGFSKNVCPSCLKKKDINLLLSNENIQPVWRMR
jgi:ubiquinone/menaquinone biosynthesis C-methylase UbiE